MTHFTSIGVFHSVIHSAWKLPTGEQLNELSKMKFDTKTMTTTVTEKYVAFLVGFGEQQKKIWVRSDGSVEDVENAVAEAYEFGTEDFRHYQIQFYDRGFEQFIDLDRTLKDDLEALLRDLSSPSKPCLTDKSYQLKIIMKTIKRKRKLKRKKPNKTFFYSCSSRLAHVPVELR